MLIERLESRSGVSKSKLLYLSATASKRYKVYDIAKRNGGFRQIAHPSITLKAVQRWITNVLVCRFPVHQCATAYRKGSNIAENARTHAETSFTLRMDFKEFFPSFWAYHLESFISEQNAKYELDLSLEDISFLVAILTRNGALTIGAPSSPSTTNAMMYEFDKRISCLSREAGVIYTRYADDLFLSARAPRVLGEMHEKIVETSSSYRYANLVLNHDKTAYLSKRYRRTITGLTITSEGKVSAGRERKRKIKAMVHKYTVGKLGKNEAETVRGFVAFIKGTDTAFFTSLQKKYGVDTVARLLRNQ